MIFWFSNAYISYQYIYTILYSIKYATELCKKNLQILYCYYLSLWQVITETSKITDHNHHNKYNNNNEKVCNVASMMKVKYNKKRSACIHFSRNLSVSSMV